MLNKLTNTSQKDNSAREASDNRCAIITLLEKASDAVKGLTGTKIVK